ncbi:MAG: carbohydrate-binding domain-containing protein [Candidatus Cryptobacteroides sp.]
MKKIFIILASALMLLGGCQKTPAPPVPEKPGYGENDNSTPQIDTGENGYDSNVAEDSDDDVVKDDGSIYWEAGDFSKVVSVAYNGSEAVVTNNVEGVTVHCSGADVTVETGTVEGVEVILKGLSSNGQITLYGSKNVKLTLDGVSLTSNVSIPVNCQKSSVLFLHLNAESENQLADASSQSDESYYPDGVSSSDEKRNGCIYTKGRLVLSGSGKLELNGNNKHGISSKKALYVRPGVTIVVNDVKDNCFKASEMTVTGGYIWAKTSADAGKCLSSDGNVTISGGTLKLYTSGGSIYEADANDTSSPSGIKADGDVLISGGEILCVSTGDGGKGISVDGDFRMTGGTVNVATSGGKFVYSASQDLDSSPKGIKVDGEIIIDGGFLNVQATGRSESSEGLESKTKITVNGGEVFSYSYDDAINVGGDKPVGIEINGGKVFAFSDNNDGIDSNAKLWVNGGIVISAGSSGMEEGFDCDNKENFIVTGGVLIGTGGGAIATSASSTQRSVIYNGVNTTYGEFFVICDASLSPILMYKMPQSMSSTSVFFSSADI